MTHNKIITGDVVKSLSRVPDESVDLVVTSPPYWTAVTYEIEPTSLMNYEEYISWLGSVWELCFHKLRANGKIVINTPILPIPTKIIKQTPRHLKNIASDIDSWLCANSKFQRYSCYIWQKQTSKLMFGSYPFPPNILENNTVEFMNVYVKPGPAKKVAKDIKEANRLAQYEWIDLIQQIWFMYPADVKRAFGHPAPFPLKLPARFIKMFTFGATESYEGDLVLDPFNGIGTTCVAAKALGRRYIGLDISEEYNKVAKQRLAKTRVGDQIEWMVGRPAYPNADALDEYSEQIRGSSLNKGKKESVPYHRKATYGRGAKKIISDDAPDLFINGSDK